MTRWEFTYIDLWVGWGKTVEDIHTVQNTIAQLGKQGWEPVGEVRFAFEPPQQERAIWVRQLMLKRPVG